MEIEHNETKPNEEIIEKGALTQELRARPIVQGIQKHWLWIAVAGGGVVALLLAGLFARSQYKLSKLEKQLKLQQNDPSAQIREENKKLVEQIGKLIVLPNDEEPTIATVNDLSKLKDQPFFAKAQLGDKVLIYNRAKKAILYRPESNQIIELAPLVGQ